MRRAFDVCVAMLRQALKPDKVNYSALISAWEKGEELRWAFDVYAAMLRPALVPSLIRDMHLRGGLGDYAATAEGQDGHLRSRGGTVDGRLVPTQHRIREWSARRITTISVPDSWPGPPRVCDCHTTCCVAAQTCGGGGPAAFSQPFRHHGTMSVDILALVQQDCTGRALRSK